MCTSIYLSIYIYLKLFISWYIRTVLESAITTDAVPTSVFVLLEREKKSFLGQITSMAGLATTSATAAIRILNQTTAPAHIHVD